MEIRLKPELQAAVEQIASQCACDPHAVVEKLVEYYLGHYRWFQQEVKKGLAQLGEGDFIEHDEVMARLERLQSQ